MNSPNSHDNSPMHSGLSAENIIYEFDFQYADNSLWVRADVTVIQAFTAISTGLLHNKPITKIQLFAIIEGERSISFVYDVTAAKKGNNPWSLFTPPPKQFHSPEQTTE